MAPPTTIIFGSSGNVGSSAARTTQELGGKVILAVRDLNKPIPGLSSEEEKSKGFERVQADLTKPETITAAVQKTGAKHAFLYIVFGPPGVMRSGIEALKSAGIEFVVFLSSGAVRGNLREISPDSGVAYAHAQVEIVLEEVFGPDGYLAVRPAYFNTNLKWRTSMLREGHVRTPYPDLEFDFISPDDIGRASATLLAAGTVDTEGTTDRNAVFLCGPKLISQKDAIGIYGKVTGRAIKVTEVDEETAMEDLAKVGLPDFVAKVLIGKMGARHRGEKEAMYADGAYEKAAANLRQYAGRVTSLEEWIEANKQLFEA